MKGHFLSGKEIERFEKYLREEEKSQNTMDKYIRDVKAFVEYCDGKEIIKETVIAYKQNLIDNGYAVKSINSMLASINSLFSFLGWYELRVKSLKVQQQIFCPEEKELTRAEYERLCRTAQQKHNERLNLILQTICGTGIRVSELQFITAEAVRKGEAMKELSLIWLNVTIPGNNIQSRTLRPVQNQEQKNTGIALIVNGISVTKHVSCKLLKVLTHGRSSVRSGTTSRTSGRLTLIPPVPNTAVSLIIAHVVKKKQT